MGKIFLTTKGGKVRQKEGYSDFALQEGVNNTLPPMPTYGHMSHDS